MTILVDGKPFVGTFRLTLASPLSGIVGDALLGGLRIELTSAAPASPPAISDDKDKSQCE